MKTAGVDAPRAPLASPAPPAPLPLWELVPLPDYRRPTLPAASAAANLWASVKKALAPADASQAEPVRDEQALRGLSAIRLEHLVRPIDWASVSALLDEHVAPGAGADPGQASPVRFLVGQAQCGHASMVRAWGERHSALVLEAPAPEQVLSGDLAWLEGVDPGRPWVLPHLEHAFLRHVHGLAAVRHLFEAVANGRAGPGWVGCGSWAWTYLSRLLPLDTVDALSLQAFDGAKMAELFAQLAEQRRTKRMQFRNARTGVEALRVPRPDDLTDAMVSDDIVQLAAHCRGNPGIACDYWRMRLRAEPEDKDATVGDGQGDDESEEVVWVASALEDRALPEQGAEDLALVLHALLMHGGLPVAVLPAVLPLPHHACVAIVHRLSRLRQLRLDAGRWNVDPLAYAGVRSWLAYRGLLVDGF